VSSSVSDPQTLSLHRLEKFARIALACVGKEYPNQPHHLLNSSQDVATPRELHPIFYGCFDWHSAVHSHWLLIKALRLLPDGGLREKIHTTLAAAFDDASVRAEADYLTAPGREPFERPYGLAWLLQLMAELRAWGAPPGRDWARTLEPLEAAAAKNVKQWLQHLLYPVRSGTHSQTAFAFGLFLDWAMTAKDRAMQDEVTAKTLAFHRLDKDAPMAYEPSGEDFFSPSLMTADLMRRVLSKEDFARWLGTFLPQLPTDGHPGWLEVARVTDETDGRLVHLHGLNLSRALNLQNVATALPESDRRIHSLRASATLHEEAGLKGVSGEHYAGSHWLATFAVYLMTGKRKISDD